MRLLAYLNRQQRAGECVTVVADAAGVRRIRDGQTVSALGWDDVTEIRAFKRSLWIVDDVRLASETQVGWYEFSEEEQGFGGLGEKMREIFPKIPAEWFAEVLQPPFATNEKTLYRRQEPTPAV